MSMEKKKILLNYGVFSSNKAQPSALNCTIFSCKSCTVTPKYSAQHSIHIWLFAPRFTIFLCRAISSRVKSLPHFKHLFITHFTDEHFCSTFVNIHSYTITICSEIFTCNSISKLNYSWCIGMNT